MTRTRERGASAVVLVAWAAMHGCGGGGGDGSPASGDDGGDASLVDAGDDGTTPPTSEAGGSDAAEGGGGSLHDATAGADAGDDVSDGSDGGGCSSDTDCAPAGLLCGLTTPGVCSPCATDADCKSDSYYQGMGWGLCDSTTHLCEQGLCAVPDGQPCAENAADVCCNGECSTGTCCSDTQCGGATPACHYHACVTCDPVAADTYYVDHRSSTPRARCCRSSFPGTRASPTRARS
jgi:hypothetical protein